MIVILKVLFKSIGRAYYYENAGLFLVFFLLAFGFLSGAEHKALAQSIAGDNTLFMFVVVFWIAHTIKTSLFVIKKNYSEEYQFIWSFSVITKRFKLIYLILLQAILNLPVTFYAIFVLNFSVFLDKDFTKILIPILLMALHVFPTIVYYNIFIKENQCQHSLIQSINKIVIGALKKPFWSWPLIASLKSKPALWLVSKPLAIMLLSGFITIHQTEEYDMRWMLLGVLLVYSINVPMIHNMMNFRSGISFVKNLSLTKNYVLRSDFSLIMAIGLFELLTLVHGYLPHNSTAQCVLLILFGTSVNWVTYLSMYMLRSDIEKYLKQYFATFVVYFFLIIFSIPIWLLLLLNTIVILMSYSKYYRLILTEPI